MKIVLTGASGQFGRAFREVAASHEIVPWARASPEAALAVDITQHAECSKAVAQASPDWVVHAAALTNVDRCEQDATEAFRVNADATRNLARAARGAGARFLYISTDYVFDGRSGGYRETDPPNPLSVYGRSKLGGEIASMDEDPRAVIARTSVVFGPHKANFVTWVIGELRAGKPVRIVEDQIVTPTYTLDLAAQVLALVQHEESGLWHAVGATRLSRLAMALEVARVFRLPMDLIQPAKSSEMTWRAPRPRDSSLDAAKISRLVSPWPLHQALEDLCVRLEDPQTS